MSDALDNYDIVEDQDTLAPNHALDIKDKTFVIDILNEKFEISMSHFNIDEDNLDEEACMLGQYMVYYGDIFAKARAVLATEEHARKTAYSEIYINIKQQMRDHQSDLYKKINDKMTESYIDNWIVAMPEYTKIVYDEYKARTIAFRAESWFKAIQKKADLLVMLGYRKNAEYKKGY